MNLTRDQEGSIAKIRVRLTYMEQWIKERNGPVCVLLKPQGVAGWADAITCSNLMPTSFVEPKSSMQVRLEGLSLRWMLGKSILTMEVCSPN